MATNQKLGTQVVSEAISLAKALTAFGRAAVLANDEMSRIGHPLIITEFYFGSLMTVDFAITELLDVAYTGNDMNAANKHQNGSANHTGITVKCTFIPLAILEAIATDNAGE